MKQNRILRSASGFLIEDTAEGRDLVVTGDWSAAARKALLDGAADGLVLNYARGYRERSLDFLQDGWTVRRLFILARTIKDLSPLYRLANTLEAINVETSPAAILDLSKLPLLVSLGADWAQVRDSIGIAEDLRRLFLMSYREQDLRDLGEHRSLASLAMKEHPQLTSLKGIDQFPALAELGVFGAGGLRDISNLAGETIGSRLQKLQLQSCPIERLDALTEVTALEFLNVGECGDIQSLHPLAALSKLRCLLLFGSTRVLDGDLTPLMHLPRLKELRMKSRREYRPSVREIYESLGQDF
jgi:hypothetical protein